MVAKLVSQFITILMLVSIYMCIRSIGRRDKKQAIIWAILFLLPVIFLAVLLMIFGR